MSLKQNEIETSIQSMFSSVSELLRIMQDLHVSHVHQRKEIANMWQALADLGMSDVQIRQICDAKNESEVTQIVKGGNEE